MKKPELKLGEAFKPQAFAEGEGLEGQSPEMSVREWLEQGRLEMERIRAANPEWAKKMDEGAKRQFERTKPWWDSLWRKR